MKNNLKSSQPALLQTHNKLCSVSQQVGWGGGETGNSTYSGEYKTRGMHKRIKMQHAKVQRWCAHRFPYALQCQGEIFIPRMLLRSGDPFSFCFSHHHIHQQRLANIVTATDRQVIPLQQTCSPRCAAGLKIYFTFIRQKREQMGLLFCPQYMQQQYCSRNEAVLETVTDIQIVDFN